MKKMKPIVKKIAVVLLSVLLLFNLSILAVGGLGATSPTQYIPISFLKVSSDSMQPTFSAGDLLMVYQADYDSLQVGDVITYNTVTEFVTHQIIAIDGDQLTTKGVANSFQDDPITSDDYLAKVVVIFPCAGFLVDWLATPVCAILLSLLLLVVLFFDLLRTLVQRLRQKTKEPFTLRPRVVAMRSLLVGIFCSGLFAFPYYTTAKYYAEINEFTNFTASAFYFDTNFLTEEGHTYNIKGWTGDEYYINLQVNNYDNDLLYNTDGADCYYGIWIVADESEGYKQLGVDYDIEISANTADDAVIETELFDFPDEVTEEYISSGPYVIDGADSVKTSRSYTITVIPIDDDGVQPVDVDELDDDNIDEAEDTSGLQPGDEIAFEVYICTSKYVNYYIEQSATFYFQVSESDDFLGQREIITSTSSDLVSYSIKTSLISDGDIFKNVVVQWDTSKLYINRYNSSVYTLLSNYPNNYDETTGTLIIPMQSLSSVTLEFFKMTSGEEIVYDDIWVYVQDDS